MSKPSYDISTFGRYLISSGPNGTAQIYQIDTTQLRNGDGVKRISDCVFSTTLLEDCELSPPKQMIRTVRTNCAKFEPYAFDPTNSNATVKRVAAIQTSNLYLYDIETSTVVAQETYGTSLLSKISFSEHAPFGSLIATCNSNSNVSIIDNRLLQEGSKKSLIWSMDNAHPGKVTDVSFNPFIPFWLASSGDDGIIKMWDIRYLKNSAARIDAHYSSISAVSSN
jgi:WD40 repeat protein